MGNTLAIWRRTGLQPVVSSVLPGLTGNRPAVAMLRIHGRLENRNPKRKRGRSGNPVSLAYASDFDFPVSTGLLLLPRLRFGLRWPLVGQTSEIREFSDSQTCSQQLVTDLSYGVHATELKCCRYVNYELRVKEGKEQIT